MCQHTARLNRSLLVVLTAPRVTFAKMSNVLSLSRNNESVWPAPVRTVLKISFQTFIKVTHE